MPYPERFNATLQFFYRVGFVVAAHIDSQFYRY